MLQEKIEKNKRMKILVVCQYFYPEEFKVNELVEGLVKRGNEVTVLNVYPDSASVDQTTTFTTYEYEKKK